MKLLVTGAWKEATSHFEELQKMGFEVIWMQDERAALPLDSEKVEAIICNGLFLHHSLDCFPSLRYIQLTSAGYDRVPMGEIAERGIKIFNAKGVYSVPMAEFAICGVLQLYKQSRFFLRNQQQHRWEKHRGLLELCSKTVCIVGIGSVAKACAERFRVFGCSVLGVNIRPRPCDYFEHVYGMHELDQVLKLADIVVLAVPLTDQTRHLMNAARLRIMKPGALLVNLARGAIVDTEALLEVLDTHLGGAILDVFEKEPIDAASPLWDKDNVLITPHNSFVGDGNQERLLNVIMENLAEYCARLG